MERDALHRQFTQMMQRFRRLKSAQYYAELTRGEFAALEMLRQQSLLHPQERGVYASVLAGHIHVSAPALSRMLKGLQSKSYIERIVDPEDRRNTYIRLTDAGSGALERAKEHLHLLLDRVLDRMGEENLRVMLGQCERLLEIIESETRKINEGETSCSEC